MSRSTTRTLSSRKSASNAHAKIGSPCAGACPRGTAGGPLVVVVPGSHPQHGSSVMTCSRAGRTRRRFSHRRERRGVDKGHGACPTLSSGALTDGSTSSKPFSSCRPTGGRAESHSSSVSRATSAVNASRASRRRRGKSRRRQESLVNSGLAVRSFKLIDARLLRRPCVACDICRPVRPAVERPLQRAMNTAACLGRPSRRRANIRDSSIQRPVPPAVETREGRFFSIVEREAGSSTRRRRPRRPSRGGPRSPRSAASGASRGERVGEIACGTTRRSWPSPVLAHGVSKDAASAQRHGHAVAAGVVHHGAVRGDDPKGPRAARGLALGRHPDVDYALSIVFGKSRSQGILVQGEERAPRSSCGGGDRVDAWRTQTGSMARMEVVRSRERAHGARDHAGASRGRTRRRRSGGTDDDDDAEARRGRNRARWTRARCRRGRRSVNGVASRCRRSWAPVPFSTSRVPGSSFFAFAEAGAGLGLDDLAATRKVLALETNVTPWTAV